MLPFANLSQDAEADYFSDGLTEELIDALTKVEGLRVIAWDSAAQIKKRYRDPRRIGEQLGVEAILEGSIRRGGGRVRISVQLVRVRDGLYLWSDKYDRELTDIFAVQDEISRAIGRALRMSFAVTEPPRRVDNVEAYHLYRKGRQQWNKRTEQGLSKSIEFFQHSIREQPSYARAYAGLGDAYLMLCKQGIEPPKRVTPKAKQAALTAIELDKTLAEAYVTLASVLGSA